MKLQGSTEYILMLVGVIIVIIAGLVFVLKTGGTATKSSGLQAELLSAEQVGANSIAFATNLQLPANATNNLVNITFTNGNTFGNFSLIGPYKVAGGYEYEITNLANQGPSGAICIVPITISNNQNLATGIYQQMITIQESSYVNCINYNGKTANFYFEYPNSEHIPAWIESNNSGTLTIFFKLNSVPATSNTIVNLVFVNKTTNELSSSGTSGIGEAPELSPVYGEYDDGQYVFNNYWNFAGTTLGSNWQEIANNGFFPSYLLIYTAINSQSPYIVDLYMTNGGRVTLGVSTGTSLATSQAKYNVVLYPSINAYGDDGGNWGLYYSNGAATELASLAGSIYESVGYNNGQALGNNANDEFNNYTIVSQSYLGWSSTNYIFLSTDVYGCGDFSNIVVDNELQLQETGDCPLNNIIYWVRTRAYPPNGIMPSYTFGPTKIIQSSSSIQQQISSITSIAYTDINGNKVTLLPTSGTSISVMPNGSFPFTISQIT